MAKQLPETREGVRYDHITDESAHNASSICLRGRRESLVASSRAVAQNPNAGSAPVTIVNPLPVPVRNVDSVSTHPFQVALCQSAAFNGATNPGCSSLPSVFHVPADSRAVIEFVSVDCRQSNVAGVRVRVSTVVDDDMSVAYAVPLHASPLSLADLSGALAVRIYADSDTNVAFTMGSGVVGASPASVSCTMAISGVLVTL